MAGLEGLSEAQSANDVCNLTCCFAFVHELLARLLLIHAYAIKAGNDIGAYTQAGSRRNCGPKTHQKSVLLKCQSSSLFFTNLVLHDLCSGLCDKTWQYVANICKSLFRIMDIDPVTLSSAAHIFLAKVVSACWVSAPSLLIKAGTVGKQERLKLTPTEAFNLLYFSIFQSRICLAKVTCPALRTAPNSSMLKKSAFSLQ